MKTETRRKILVVDNNEQILVVLQSLLEGAGFDTSTTWSGREALCALRSEKFDLLLVDDYLPDLHSTDFMERVARLRTRPSIVVMQSAPPKSGALRHYQALGASAVVDKSDSATVCRAVVSHCAGMWSGPSGHSRPAVTGRPRRSRNDKLNFDCRDSAEVASRG